MNASKARYDAKEKLTRIHLSDYLALKAMSRLAGISMAEALHRLIEHQAQLPLMSRFERSVTSAGSIPVASSIQKSHARYQVGSIPVTAVRSTPVTISFASKVVTNGPREVDGH